jgi:hypothetical protein
MEKGKKWNSAALCSMLIWFLLKKERLLIKVNSWVMLYFIPEPSFITLMLCLVAKNFW